VQTLNHDDERVYLFEFKEGSPRVCSGRPRGRTLLLLGRGLGLLAAALAAWSFVTHSMISSIGLQASMLTLCDVAPLAGRRIDPYAHAMVRRRVDENFVGWAEARVQGSRLTAAWAGRHVRSFGRL
jgi:hypothetical protein